MYRTPVRGTSGVRNIHSNIERTDASDMSNLVLKCRKPPTLSFYYGFDKLTSFYVWYGSFEILMFDRVCLGGYKRRTYWANEWVTSWKWEIFSKFMFLKWNEKKFLSFVKFCESWFFNTFYMYIYITPCTYSYFGQSLAKLRSENWWNLWKKFFKFFPYIFWSQPAAYCSYASTWAMRHQPPD